MIDRSFFPLDSPDVTEKRAGIRCDRWILSTVLFLLGLGLLMLASASMGISDHRFGHPFHYLWHQSLAMILGLVVMVGMTYVPIAWWKRYSGYFFLIALLLLILVLIPRVGIVVNGGRRWIHLGFFSVQVSEWVKLCALVYLARYLSRYQEEIRKNFRSFLKPMLLFIALSVLLLLEPDFGTAVVIGVTGLLVLFIGGTRLWPFLIFWIWVIASVVLLIMFAPYRLQRVTSFLNPWHSPFDSGYQLTQSLIAFGRGGWFGVGLGNSVQKLFYLPEAHTDFLFAVLAEEFGLVGEILVLAAFTLLVSRLFWVARGAERRHNLFSAYLAYGIAISLALQVMVNVGVNIGLLPTKGLTLPLMSYGGSSLLMTCTLIGLTLRIAYERHKDG